MRKTGDKRGTKISNPSRQDKSDWTLAIIYWMGIRNQAPEVSRAASELGAFYKLSLGNGESIVTLEYEIRHIEAYVDIQNLRFNNSITLQPLFLFRFILRCLTSLLWL